MLQYISLISICISAQLPESTYLNQQPTLEINVSNVKRNSGKVVVEIYKDKSNWLKTPFQKLVLSSNQDLQTASFQVPHGKYAISIYQDLNENGQLDQAAFGIPKEPIGFGNNYKPFGKPKFDAALIEFKPTSKPQSIKLFTVF